MSSASEPAAAPAGPPKDRVPQDRVPQGRAPKDAIVFDDPLARRSSDDTDQGWGERTPVGDGSPADLARFLDEKPPHHL